MIIAEQCGLTSHQHNGTMTLLGIFAGYLEAPIVPLFQCADMHQTFLHPS